MWSITNSQTLSNITDTNTNTDYETHVLELWPITMLSERQAATVLQFLRLIIRKAMDVAQFFQQGCCSEEPSLTKRGTTAMGQPYVRIVVIFSCVIVFSLLGAWFGCIVASCHVRRRKSSQRENSNERRDACGSAISHTPFSSVMDHSSECDVEMQAQLDAIMANENFRGREWNVYKREKKAKARRHARGFMRTSQGVILPTNARQLKRRIGAISRSLMLSMTRSDIVQEPVAEPVPLDNVLERSRNLAIVTKLSEEFVKSDRRNNTKSESSSISTLDLEK